ncbi:MAG TPA: hypothetical protein VF604_19425 [Pyrinomonadaceae bacterium]|jgi:hypothetical protein
MSDSNDYGDFGWVDEGDPLESPQEEKAGSGVQQGTAQNQNRNRANQQQNGNATQANASSNAAAAESYTPPEGSEGCAIIGPSGSGKTTLLAAIERSCEMPGEDGITLEFYPEPGITYLIRRVISNVVHKRAEYSPTFKVDDYGFRICVTEKAESLFSLPLEVDFRGELSDSGGGTIFPTIQMEEEMAKRPEIRRDFESESAGVLERLRNASSIILCVDASQPNIRLLYERMSIVLSQTRDQNSIERRRLTLIEKMNRWIRRREIPEYIERVRPSLKAKRFLLLLTHIDQLCESAANPELMARMANPVIQARETLGASLLDKIRKSLPKSAEFAVGVCSPWGFNGEEKGWKPFADANGQVYAVSNEQGEELLLRWKPFGVRDAIYFIATGKCRGSVAPVTEQQLITTKSPAKMYVSG